MSKPNPFKGFHSGLEIIRLTVMMYIRFPLSLRNVEDLLHERGTDICYETVRHWWQRFVHPTTCTTAEEDTCMKLGTDMKSPADPVQVCRKMRQIALPHSLFSQTFLDS